MSDQLDLLRDAPGAAHAVWRGAPETERFAAVAVTAWSGKQRCQYMLASVGSEDRGLTDHEAHALGIGSSYHVAGTRRAEIVDENGERLVLDSGLRRLSPHGSPCAVWVASETLFEFVEEHFDAIVARANK